MRYWDASALVPLLFAEEGSELVRDWLREDPSVATWHWTVVEITSAIERRVREALLSRSARREALERLDDLASSWDEVADVAPVRQRAMALLARHPIRAADAAQLGAALLVSENHPASLEVVCLDDRLALAAEREGFRVLTWPADQD